MKKKKENQLNDEKKENENPEVNEKSEDELMPKPINEENAVKIVEDNPVQKDDNFLLNCEENKTED